MKRWCAVRLTGCFCILAAAAFSQSAPGTIAGVITDPEGGAFAIAFVQLRNTQTAALSNVASAAGGKYRIASVAAGIYALSVNVPGMKAWQRTGIVVQPGQASEIDVLMEDGPSLRTLGEDPASLDAVFINRPPPPNGPTPRTADGGPDFPACGWEALPHLCSICCHGPRL